MNGGWISAMGRCFGCGRLFSFHPRKVPSYQNQPICRSCIERANAKREENGLELWPIPEGAYEPAPENEVF